MPSEYRNNWLLDGYSVPSWLPDWRHEDEYPDASSSKQSFMWEFLRRNPLYHYFYKSISDLCIDEGVQDTYRAEFGFYLPPSQGELVTEPESIVFHCELYRTLTIYGFFGCLFDPAYELREDISLQWLKRTGRFEPSVETFSYHSGGLLIGPEEIPLDGRIIPKEGEVLHLFDLSLPIAPQIKRVNMELKEAQKEKFGKALRASSTELKMFPLYLRLLDADARGVEDSVIGKTLFSDKKKYSEYSDSEVLYSNDSHRSPRADALRSAREGAYPLLLGDYKKLL